MGLVTHDASAGIDHDGGIFGFGDSRGDGGKDQGEGSDGDGERAAQSGKALSFLVFPAGA
jgi:hypothetical protein